MKLFYFLQELKGVPLGYDFRLFTYGPFDSEVLSDLATAFSLDMVKEETEIFARGYGYKITAGLNAEQLSRDLETSDRALAAQVDAVVQEFGSLGAGELELRSTLFFVDQELIREHSTIDRPGFARRVREIKPHFSEATILNRIEDMSGKGWLLSPAAQNVVAK